MRITLLPGRRVIEAIEGESLLAAVRRAGEPISYSCTDGRCGLCRCFVAALDGQIIDGQALPELRECLACQTALISDGVVEIPDTEEPVVLPALAAKGRVDSVESLSFDAVRVRVEMDRPFQFLGGQHFEVTYLGQPKRLYSATARSEPGSLVFDIQLHPHGAVSQFVRDALRVGNVVRVRGPLGRAHLRRKHNASIVLIASGTGLGAMTSLMRDIAVAKLPNPVYAYAGFAFSEQVYGREELSRFAALVPALRRCDVVVASGALQRGDRRGLLTEAVKKDFASLYGFSAYLFGAPSAVEATARRLLDKGMNPRFLHSVPFHPTELAEPYALRPL
jgi:naphthalene 1,2-dioxygenase ferredoxin reductase component